MALLEIPTRNDLPSYQQQIKLDGVAYVIALNFNPRMNAGAGNWMLTLADQNANMLVGPVPVIVNQSLLGRFPELTSLPGTLFAFDTTGNNLDPGQFALGDTVRLFYLESGTVL